MRPLSGIYGDVVFVLVRRFLLTPQTAARLRAPAPKQTPPGDMSLAAVALTKPFGMAAVSARV